MRTSFFFLLCVAMTLGGCARQAGAPHGDQRSGGRGVAVGEPAPALTLKDIDGKTVSLAQLRGKPVFINAFATWCPPCKLELPGIVKAYPQYKDQVVFLGVDEQEDAELVTPFLKRFGITYQVALDPGSFADAYEVHSLPWSFFIDKDGVVRKIERGFMTPDELKGNLAAIDKG